MSGARFLLIYFFVTVFGIKQGEPVSGCRWVRVRVTLENINGNSAQWIDAYDDSLSADYRQLTSKLLSVFRMVYDSLTDYKSSVLPTIRRSPEGLIKVIIGIEFNSPYGSDLETVHQALIDSLDSSGVIDVSKGDETDIDIIPSTLAEECVCPSNFCLRGPSCSPSENDFSSSCQCPGNYAPPRCEHLLPSSTLQPRARGIIYGRLAFHLQEVDDQPVSWDPIYDDPFSTESQKIRNGLETVLTEVFSRKFTCLRKVTVVDFYNAYSQGIGAIVGVEFTQDCGNSENYIRTVFVNSIDSDGKIDGSIYELDRDLISAVGTEEICGPFFSCANGGVCEPSVSAFSSSCRCFPPYTGSRCVDVIDVKTTVIPQDITVKDQVLPKGLTDEELIIILVSSILGAAILIGLILCVICFYCCPAGNTRYVYDERKDAGTRGFADRYERRAHDSDDWPWSATGRPPVTYNGDTFQRNFKNESKGVSKGPHVALY